MNDVIGVVRTAIMRGLYVGLSTLIADGIEVIDLADAEHAALAGVAAALSVVVDFLAPTSEQS